MICVHIVYLSVSDLWEEHERKLKNVIGNNKSTGNGYVDVSTARTYNYYDTGIY